MRPGPLDLPIVWRGCNWATITTRWLDQNGNPIDLTGWRCVATSKQINFHPVVTDPPNAYVTIGPLTNVETANLNLGVEPWDLLFIHSSGAVFPTPLLAGEVEIKEPLSSTAVST